MAKNVLAGKSHEQILSAAHAHKWSPERDLAQALIAKGSKPKLISTSHTSKSEKIIRGAASAKFGRKKLDDAFFEHGAWFVIVRGRYYSVVDALPGVDNRGIDFEALG